MGVDPLVIEEVVPEQCVLVVVENPVPFDSLGGASTTIALSYGTVSAPLVLADGLLM